MQSVLLKAGGLYTFPNNLSEIPPGALTLADNVVIDKNGIIESRRGLKQYGNTFGIGTDTAKQLMTYKNVLLRHYQSTIQYDSNNLGNFLSFDGDFDEVVEGLRIKFIEANGNFYFTTSAGIYTISAANSSQFTTAPGYIRQAGGVQALDLNGILDYTSGGWFIYQTDQPGQSMVAYRMTWAYYDANNNLVEGVPSSRLVLTNYSETDSANVTLTFQIPTSITTADTQFFYRIYRTAVVQTSLGVTLATLDPGDEQYLIIQDYPTSGELSSRTVSVTDITPEAFRRNGSLLYTNPVSGEGINQANYPPPIAKDINLFQNTVFYANTQTIQQLNLSLLSTSNLVSGSSYIFINSNNSVSSSSLPGLVTANTIHIANTLTLNQVIQYTTTGTPITGLTNNAYYYVINPTGTSFQLSLTAGGGAIVLSSNGTGTQTFTLGSLYTFVGTKEITKFTFDTKANTTDGGYFLINSASNDRKYFVWYNKSGAQESTTFTFGNTVATTNDGGYFLLNSANDTSKYFIWFDKTGTTPAPSGTDTNGRIGVRVSLVGLTTTADIATAVANAIPSANFLVNYSGGNTVNVTNITYGTTTNAVAGSLTPGASFSISIVTNGANATTQPSAGDTVGRLPIVVDITQAVSANDVAVATSNALNDITDFSAVPSTNTSTVTNTDNGATTNAVNGATPVGGAFAILIMQNGTGEDTSTQQVLLGDALSPSISIDETARSLVKNINSNPNESVNAYYLSGPTDLPGLILLQARNLVQGSFFVIADSTATGAEFNPTIPISGNSVTSTNLVELNAIYYSKFQQPEAVPTVNKFLVGPKDKAIVRILPLRTGLMILKEDGIYRLTGTNGQFNIDPFDNSAIIIAPDSAQVLNNQIYMFSTQGIVTLTDTGVSVISRPIEDLLNRITAPAFNYASNTFGVAYESDRAYLLWTVTNSNDDLPTQCFRFNTFTTSWTRWPISKTCGIVKFNEQRLYLGAGDENFIEQERKNIDRTDYADRESTLEIPQNAVQADGSLTLSSVTGVVIGDVLLQTQYLSTYQFNQLLKMLDADPGTNHKDYFSRFQIVAGGDMRSSLDNLALRMDTDSGLSETNFFSSMGHGSSFSDFQSDFNILTNLLNLNAHTLIKNYRTSTGTINFETLIEGTVQNSTDVEIQYLPPFIEGPVTLVQGIKTEIIWAPQTFGDPSVSKHVSEGTFIFNDTVFNTATISYASDLMPSFEEVSFNESGLGDWGDFIWGNQYWGGQGSSVPMRTYIPRNKQYCRFLRPRFEHTAAREKFELLGTSLTFRALTERAYRS